MEQLEHDEEELVEQLGDRRGEDNNSFFSDHRSTNIATPAIIITLQCDRRGKVIRRMRRRRR